MPELKALIFDVDGTLADTERDGHRVAFNLAFADAGLSWNWTVDIYEDLLSVTGGKERIKFFLDKYQPEFDQSDDLAGFIAAMHKAKTAHYTDLLARGDIPLRPGVARILNEARKEGLRLAISTTTTPENVEALLLHTLGKESMAWFEIIAAGDIVPAKKPAPDIYDYALMKMNLKANECIAFEDSRNGILSSLAANLKTVITINDYTKHCDFTGAVIVLDQYGEPDSPFKVIAGDSHGFDYVNIEMIKALHRA
jgi:beta-phosphoglucomutase-like phosphatase (HAD superfamily)